MKKIPKQTRIILIPNDERSSREYSISRGMVFGLAISGTVLFVVVFLVLASFGGLTYRLWQTEIELEELSAASRNIERLEELEGELQQTRELQKRLLALLGVEPSRGSSATDSLARSVNRYSPQNASSVLAETASEILTPPPDLWPASGHVTQEFIVGDFPAGIRPHPGIDIAGPLDSPIVASGSGLVRRARWDDYLGNYVEIQHGFGYVTVYGHCSRLTVHEGDNIRSGQAIGYLGGSGQVSAPHLHFEIWFEGEAVDPRMILSGDPPR